MWVDKSYLTSYSETFLPWLFPGFWGMVNRVHQLFLCWTFWQHWSTWRMDQKTPRLFLPRVLLQQATWAGDDLAFDEWAPMSPVSYSSGWLEWRFPLEAQAWGGRKLRLHCLGGRWLHPPAAVVGPLLLSCPYITSNLSPPSLSLPDLSWESSVQSPLGQDLGSVWVALT